MQNFVTVTDYFAQLGTQSFQREMQAQIDAARDAAAQQEQIALDLHNRKLSLMDEEMEAIRRKLEEELLIQLEKDEQALALKLQQIEDSTLRDEQEAVQKEITEEDARLLKEQREQEHQERLNAALKEADTKKQKEQKAHDKASQAQAADNAKKVAALEQQMADGVKKREKEIATFRYMMTLAQWKVEQAAKMQAVSIQQGIGTINAVSSAMSLGSIFGPIAAAANVALVSAAANQSRAMIAASIPPLPPPELMGESGGLFKGPSHARGGINANVEGGELLIAKDETQRILDAVESPRTFGGMPDVNVNVLPGAVVASKIDLDDTQAVEDLFGVLRGMLREEIRGYAVAR
jgi:hypothetical protein